MVIKVHLAVHKKKASLSDGISPDPKEMPQLQRPQKKGVPFNKFAIQYVFTSLPQIKTAIRCHKPLLSIVIHCFAHISMEQINKCPWNNGAYELLQLIGQLLLGFCQLDLLRQIISI
jgi:hypothetical protein